MPRAGPRAVDNAATFVADVANPGQALSGTGGMTEAYQRVPFRLRPAAPYTGVDAMQRALATLTDRQFDFVCLRRSDTIIDPTFLVCPPPGQRGIRDRISGRAAHSDHPPHDIDQHNDRVRHPRSDSTPVPGVPEHALRLVLHRPQLVPRKGRSHIPLAVAIRGGLRRHRPDRNESQSDFNSRIHSAWAAS
jgi:hypothetical protein